MNRYLIRTDKNERKTRIVSLGNPSKMIGLVYTDFLLRLGGKEITKEEVVNPETDKPIGQIVLHRKNDLVVVEYGGKEIAALSKTGDYREGGQKMPIKTYSADDLPQEKYANMRAMGLKYAYSLSEKSRISHAFCFERGNNLAGIVFGRDGEERSEALKGLALILAKRIESQDYVFEFLK